MGETMGEIYTRLAGEGRLTADPAQLAVLPELQRIRGTLEAAGPPARGLKGFFRKGPEPIRGLYLWGGVGRGKSMLMDLFFSAVEIEQKRRVHFHAFMQEVQAGLHEARKTGVDDALRPVADEVIRDLRLLCFDEMQITDITDAMIVGRLFERLFEAGVAVVTTSNRVPGDLYKDGLNRQLFLPFITLLEERLAVWELTSPTDYRQDRLEGEQVYFTPADATARDAISDLWITLSGGGGAPLVLPVKGRDVVLPAFRNGVARASFWDLCGQPLGPADYLAVAEAVKVLILEDVPRLSSENFNEAKRFVTLVDALYEAHVRVILSAADIPERLYIEGAGSFEFERTASRLREMQSAEWAAG
ncbi:MAG: cell division protein ZapE [Pseudomonadota bacterium]